MERLGIYIFIFFFLGLTFFERARLKGETGSLWTVLPRNLGVLLFAVAGAYVIAIQHEPTAHWQDLLLPCLMCGASALIVAVGVWELRIQIWKKLILVVVFSLVIFPWFKRIESGMAFYDHAGALLIWALPAAFVLGFRLLVPGSALPEERTHDMKGYKILPGMKHRFLFSRGIGFTMIFLVLNATTFVGHTFVISKTLTVLTASFTILFCNMFFYGLFGRNQMERYSYAPPFFAVMGTLVATQACNQYTSEQAILASAVTTFVIMFYLRTVPLKVRFWDPVCSTPIFLLGGICGVLMSVITKSAELKSQVPGVFVCLAVGIGAGAVLSLAMRIFRTKETALVISGE